MTSANTAPFFRQQFFGPNGQPLTGGRIEFYSAGSATPKSVYGNRNYTINLGNVLSFNDAGVPVQYFMGEGEYDIKIFDQFNQLIDNPLRIDAHGNGGSPFPDPANPGFLRWDGSVYAWIEVPMYPTPGNSGYLHYDIDTGTYSWTSITSDDHKVMTDAFDTNPGYLSDKVVSGEGIVVEEVIDTERYLKINSQGTLKVDDADTLDYLDTKFQNTDSIEWSTSGHKMEAHVGGSIIDNQFKVKTLGSDPAGYLGAKLASSSDIIKSTDVNGVVSFTLSGDIQPHGLAGGDLTGYYPDPLVKELSGLGTSFAPIDARQAAGGGVFNPGGAPYSLSFKAVRGYGLFVTNNGALYYTTDGGLTFASCGYSLGFTVRDIDYGKINASTWGWCITGNNTVAWFEDIVENYTLGVPKQSAWKSEYVAGSWADVHFSAGQNLWLFAEQSSGIKYVSELINGMTLGSVIPKGSDNFVGGVFSEASTGKAIYFERGTGRVWYSDTVTTANSWIEVLDGTTPILKKLYPAMSDLSGVGAGVSMGDISTFAGQIVITTTDVTDPDAYMVGMNVGELPALWNINTDGANWYCTTIAATSPILYQLFLGSIPSHRQFVAEKGLVAYGDILFPDLPDAGILGTDNFGKVVIKPDTTGLVKATPGDLNPDTLAMKITGSGNNVVVTAVGPIDDPHLEIIVKAQGSPGSSGYINTMDVANAIHTIAPNMISRSELVCLFVPENNFYLDLTSKFGMFVSQGGTGNVIFTLRDSQYRLIAYSATTTNPTPSVFLESLCTYIQDPVLQISRQNYRLSIGGRYYLGVNWDANGIQILGNDAVQNTNIQPYPAYKVDNLSSIPNQLTGGGESKMRPFIRMLTQGTF